MDIDRKISKASTEFEITTGEITEALPTPFTDIPAFAFERQASVKTAECLDEENALHSQVIQYHKWIDAGGKADDLPNLPSLLNAPGSPTIKKEMSADSLDIIEEDYPSEM